VYNRGKHDHEWEEPLLKRIKHLKELTMRAEAKRGGKRFKHAVTALSVMSYKTGQKFFYRTLAAMTGGQLLAALEAGSVELSISGATPPAHQPTPPTPQPTSQHLAPLSGSMQNQPVQPAAQPRQPRKEASPLDRHQGWGRQQRASQEQKSEDSLAQSGTSSQNRPKEDQPAGEAPQAQPPAATPDLTANEKKTRQSKKKAIKLYWARKFRKGE
jgi:type IV secretory pathway VirB10-like protein